MHVGQKRRQQRPFFVKEAENLTDRPELFRINLLPDFYGVLTIIV
jgi:hypothetical protein